MSNSPITDEISLYTYYRSSCSARLRIALRLKNLPHTQSHISLTDGSHKSSTYTSTNPSGTVPTLIIKNNSGSEIKITQSIAALEYLEEAYPTLAKPLLPHNPALRAKVRELVNIVACDIQPPTNLNILQFIEKSGGNKVEFAKKKMSEGLKAYEALLKDCGGKYSAGDELTLADVCLQPAVWNALRFGVDFSQIPRVKEVSDRLAEVEAFQKAHWNCQPDTPEELRGKEK